MVNNFERAALYHRVRVLKSLTFVAALGLGVLEMQGVEKQWKYYDRFYPEATELQKSLYREAMMFKELQNQPKTVDQRLKLDTETAKIYEQMYRLPPQKYADPDDDPNPASIKPHY